MKLIDVNIPNILALDLEHSPRLWSWKKILVLRKGLPGLQLCSGGTFIPSLCPQLDELLLCSLLGAEGRGSVRREMEMGKGAGTETEMGKEQEGKWR